MTKIDVAGDVRAIARGDVLAGLGLASVAYALFAIQDATVKWLVADYTVWQVLFVRSATIVLLSSVAARPVGLGRALRSPNKPVLLLRAAATLSAWLCFYSAARHLGLADLVTLYYAAPLFVTVLSIILLGEQVTAARWAAVVVGLAGVLIAANPTGRPDLWPALLVLAAALLWALSTILPDAWRRSRARSPRCCSATPRSCSPAAQPCPGPGAARIRRASL